MFWLDVFYKMENALVIDLIPHKQVPSSTQHRMGIHDADTLAETF